jgi:hypothetical protein
MLANPLHNTLLACLATAACLSACGGGDDTDTSTTTVTLYKHAGAVQCGSSGLSLSSMERELVEARVRVVSASCGSDGMIYPAICGSTDGRIGIFEIATSHRQAASARGFLLLSDKPTAISVPCPTSDSPPAEPAV